MNVFNLVFVIINSAEKTTIEIQLRNSAYCSNGYAYEIIVINQSLLEQSSFLYIIVFSIALRV